MALGRRNQEQQPSFWIAVDELPRSEGHVFYRKLNQLLREAGFDEFVESLCEPYYHDSLGRPGIPPGVYFRMLLVGYFEGLGSQRGIAWRCADSLSLREFLGMPLGGRDARPFEPDPGPRPTAAFGPHGRVPVRAASGRREGPA